MYRNGIVRCKASSQSLDSPSSAALSTQTVLTPISFERDSQDLRGAYYSPNLRTQHVSHKTFFCVRKFGRLRMLLQKVEPAQDAPASSDVSNVRKRAFHTFQSFGKRIPGHLVEHLPALLARASTAAKPPTLAASRALRSPTRPSAARRSTAPPATRASRR